MRRIVEAAASSGSALAHARVDEAVDVQRGAVPVPMIEVQEPGYKLHKWVAAKRGREAATATARGGGWGVPAAAPQLRQPALRARTKSGEESGRDFRVCAFERPDIDA